MVDLPAKHMSLDSSPSEYTGLSFSPLSDEEGLSFKGPTCLEFALYDYLAEKEVEFIPEWNVPGTNYLLDAYDPITKVGYEADGYPTHFTTQGMTKDRKRDKKILSLGEVVEIKRFTYDDLKFWL